MKRDQLHTAVTRYSFRKVSRRASTLNSPEADSSEGYNIDKLADRVADIFSIKPEEIFQPGKQPIKAKARSLFCYWAVRELGLTMADLDPKLNISQPAVSMRDL